MIGPDKEVRASRHGVGFFTESMPSPSTCELLDEAGMDTGFKHLNGKRVGLVVLSTYPFDPRPRRTADVCSSATV